MSALLYHDDRVPALLDAYRETSSGPVAAQRVGVSYATAYRWLHRYGAGAGVVVPDQRTPAEIEAEALRLYVEERLPFSKVADRLRISDQTAHRIVKEAGVERRGNYTREPVRYLDYERPDGSTVRLRILGRHSPDVVRRVLNAYVRGAQPSDLARRYRASIATIEKWCARAGVTRRRYQARQLVIAKQLGLKRVDLALVKAEAERLYVGEGLSCTAVARRLTEAGYTGIGGAMVHRWLRRRGVVRTKVRTLGYRPVYLSRALRERLTDEAVRLYRKGLCSTEVATLLNSTEAKALAGRTLKAATVGSWLRRRGETRSIVEALQLRYSRRRARLQREAFRLVGRGYGDEAIREQLAVSPYTLRRLLMVA